MIHCFQKRKHRLAYEWYETKNKANIRKHGVSFQEAAEALEDPDAIEMYDENHSYGNEDRFICIGATSRFLLLMVVYMDRFGNGKDYFRKACGL